MKLRNKKTGEIRDFIINKDKIQTASAIDCWEYNSLAEFNEEWEDYKELEYWYIDNNGVIIFSDLDDDKLWEDLAKERKQIGNYFETKEEAEKAVEKLKAWKRLKDKGFKFVFWYGGSKNIDFVIGSIDKETAKDLDLLFGGEE